uniref:NmrA domain-containing protein n=1 Tax=Ganoderma boninense TaxID=34458 RepID=A0A5K1K672_9APHY|nr:NmrA domain-containing protein [Ganoderma boninense]
MNYVAGTKDVPFIAIVESTKVAFMKLLENRRSEIESQPQKAFQFGETDRHQLDVYYPDPAAVSADGTVPVLFFIYGGGFAAGDRKYKAPLDLGYANLGTFFAKRGRLIPPHTYSILTVIPDYRLFPNVVYPAPVEDVRDAIAWVLANARTIASAAPSTIPASTALSSVFVLGHSAGANHVASLYLSPSLLPLDSPVRAATRGLVPQGCPYVFDFAARGTRTGEGSLPRGIVDGYYGSEAQATARMPLALLDAGTEELVRGLPEFFVLKSAIEPALIDKGNDAFVQALEGPRIGR